MDSKLQKQVTVINDFKSELTTLLNKYNFGRKEHASYNGQDEYLGEEIYLTIDGEPYYSETLAEIIKETFGDIGEL